MNCSCTKHFNWVFVTPLPTWLSRWCSVGLSALLEAVELCNHSGTSPGTSPLALRDGLGAEGWDEAMPTRPCDPSPTRLKAAHPTDGHTDHGLRLLSQTLLINSSWLLGESP